MREVYNRMARVLILGGGFAAISAAETITASIGSEHEVMLVSNSSDFTFYPAIVPMVFGDFKPDEVKFDLRPKLAERGINFLKGDVRAINTRRRTVEVAGDRIRSTVGYDHLIVAVGRRLVMGFVPGLAEYAHSLLSIDAALKFKEAIASFESGAIVVGLCPGATLPVPVCESALALARRFHNEIESGKVSISVVVPATLDKAFEGSALFRDIEQEFDRAGVRLVSDFAVSDVSKSELKSVLGAKIRHDLLMLIPPFGGQLSLRSLGHVANFSGFANVNSRMQVDGLESVYAAGDIIGVPGPKFGYMAIRQGKVAGANVLAELAGEEPSAEYTHKLEWAIGEKYTDPVFFHYGFWDETLNDFDDTALFGMARKLREHYGPVTIPSDESHRFAA